MSKRKNDSNGGRPTILTPERHKVICDAIADGATREVAAAAAGVGESTLYQWLKKGRDGLEPYVEFAEAIEKADAEGELSNIRTIKSASASTWQAAAWLLERKHPERWGRRDRMDVTQMNLTPDDAPDEDAKASLVEEYFRVRG